METPSSFFPRNLHQVLQELRAGFTRVIGVTQGLPGVIPLITLVTLVFFAHNAHNSRVTPIRTPVSKSSIIAHCVTPVDFVTPCNSRISRT